MSSALYRKYRPQTFADMIGQNHIKITLQHELERGEIAHAYLFCGPRGLGKTTSARLFAKAVNCANRAAGASEPCNECESCRDIIAGRAVDIIEIDAASNTGVDNVRENIIENSRFNPVRSKFKVFIIDEVHMLSTSAFNALLKIMEEPPAHVIFILCTTEIHKLPLTIISRCQRFDFKKVTGEQLIGRLEKVVSGEKKSVEPEVLKRIVAAAEGCVRDAESLLAKVLSLGDEISLAQADLVLPRSDYERIASFVGYLSEKNAAAAIEIINRLIDEGFDLAVFADNLLEFLRQMLLIKTSGQLEAYGIDLSAEADQSVKSLAAKFSWNELLEMIEVFSDKSKEIKRAAIYQLPLEVAVIMLTERLVKKAEPAVSVAGNAPTGGQAIAAKAPAAAIAPSIPAAPAASAAIEKTVAATKTEPMAAVTETAADAQEASPSAAEPATEPMAVARSAIDLNQIVAAWPRVVQKLIKTNFTLGSLLKMSQPLAISGDKLDIGVATAFYQGRLEANNNRPIIEACLGEELGGKIIIRGVVRADIEPIAVEVDYDEESAAPAAENAQSGSASFAAPAFAPVAMSTAEEVMNLL